jgi:hypothetical protein
MSQVVRQQSAKLFRLVRFQYGTCNSNKLHLQS